MESEVFCRNVRIQFITAQYRSTVRNKNATNSIKKGTRRGRVPVHLLYILFFKNA